MEMETSGLWDWDSHASNPNKVFFSPLDGTCSILAQGHCIEFLQARLGRGLLDFVLAWVAPLPWPQPPQQQQMEMEE